MALKTTRTVADFPHLVAQWDHVKNGSLRPSDVAAGSHKKVHWKCHEGRWPDGTVADDHEWGACPNNRTSPTNMSGCPCCAGKKAVPSNCLATTHPAIAAQWHPTKNDKLTPNKVLAGSIHKVHWKCHEGRWPDGTAADDHEWEASPNSRSSPSHMSGCPCCAGKKVVPSNYLATTHPEIAAQWHPTKNGSLQPSDVVAGSHRKVHWACREGRWPDGTVADDHEWKAPVKDRTRERGCPCCAGKKVVPSNCLATTHPAIAAQWHPTKNKKLTPENVTAGSGQKVYWKCHEGRWPNGTAADDHEWETSPNNRTNPMNKGGCPCCSDRKVVPSNCLATTHPEVAAQWHPTKNEELTPNELVAGSDRKVWWRCPDFIAHVWQSKLYHRTIANSGCPRCSQSKGEKAIATYLLGHRIRHKPQWSDGGRAEMPKRYRFDFAVNRNGAFWLIEYHGEQHYRPTAFGSKAERASHENFLSGLKRDAVKERWCRQRQKNLLVIPYWEFDRIGAILDEFFAGQMPVMAPAPEIVRKYESMRQKRDRLRPPQPA